MHTLVWSAAVLIALVAAPASAAGNVTVSFSGRRLVVQGDAEDNTIIIDAGNGRGVVVTGVGDTTVNGVSSVVADDVTGIRVKMDGGADTVTVQRMTVNGTLSVRAGDGNDDVLVTDAYVAGSLYLKGGRGGDVLSVVNTAVAGDLSMQGGSGSSTITVDTVSVPGYLTLSGGGGRDVVSVYNFDGYSGRRATIGTGAGSDVLNLQVASFDGFVDAEMGSGNDFVTVADVFFDDGAEIDGGSGHDDVFIGYVDWPDGEDVDFDGF